MTIKTVKGRDLPNIYAHDKVRFVLVPGNKELEVSCYCKHTRNMGDGTITIYLQYPEPAAESEEKEIDRLRKENKRLQEELDIDRRIFSHGYPGFH